MIFGFCQNSQFLIHSLIVYDRVSENEAKMKKKTLLLVLWD
jgi:hypothetical protein